MAKPKSAGATTNEENGGDTERVEKNGMRAADREEVNALLRKATGLHLIHASEEKARRSDVLKAALKVYITHLKEQNA